MLETEQVKRAEDFRRKSDETKRAAFEHEILRLEKETELRGTSLAKMLQLKDKHLFEELTKDAESTRKREEELLSKRESEIRARLKDEHAKKRARRAEEARLRREEEQEKLAREARLEEENRSRAEHERRQQEEQLRTDEEEADVQDEEERMREEAAERSVNSVLHGNGESHPETEAERRQRDLDEERLRQEETMRLQREEFRKREEERIQREAEQRKLESELRLQEEETFRREQEEENLRRQQEDERRQREEEENLRKQEEDRLRVEAEEKVRIEEDLKRQIEERHRQEEELKRQEAEERLRVEQTMHEQDSGNREGRIQELLSNAEAFYAKGNFEHALVEVAKALVNNPTDEAAILLEKKIKEAQGIQEPEEEAKPAHKRSKRRELKPRFERPEKRNALLARPLVAVGAVVIVAVLVFVAIQLKQKIFPVTTTVAILPWTSATNNAQEAAIGSSLAEEVARQFYQYNQASAMGFSSVLGVSRTSAEPEQALSHIGCSYLLHGSLTKSALGVSIRLQLVDSLGSVRWSERYDRGIASLPSLPAEIAEHVASALELSRDRMPAPPTPTTSAEAYLLYLEGIELLHHHTRPDFLSAADTLQHAIRLDPLFVQALAAASMCYSTMIEENWVSSDTYLGVARDLAEKAVQANPRVGDGFVALGRALTLLRDFTGAAEQYAKALKCSPTNSLVFLNEGKNLLRIGSYKEAVKALTRAYDLDPRNPEILQTLGFANELDGTSEQAAWYLQAALPFVPDSVDYLIGPINDAILLNPELSLTQSARVISACEHRIVQNPDDFATIYRLSRTLQVTGKRIEGTTLLDKLEKDLRARLKSDPNNSTAMIYLALTLTRMGRFPEATSWGQKAIGLRPYDPVICFRLAQMYSLQMYSPQRKKIDEQKKTESVKALKQALRLSYRLDELTNADFYNMYEHGDFASVIATNPQ